MLDEILRNPDRIGAFVLLGMAVAAFYTGKLMTRAAHDADVKDLKDEYTASMTRIETAHQQHVVSMLRELDRSISECTEYRRIVLQQIEITNRLLEDKAIGTEKS
jgi:hypothetical protein